jgi:hypothetical protein
VSSPLAAWLRTWSPLMTHGTLLPTRSAKSSFCFGKDTRESTLPSPNHMHVCMRWIVMYRHRWPYRISKVSLSRDPWCNVPRQVASGTPSGRPLVTVSHDGGHVAVAWPGARRYIIYQQGASAWRE